MKKNEITRFLMVLGFCCSLISWSTQAQSVHMLTIQVKGAKPNEGQIALALYKSEANFLKEADYSEMKAVDSEGKANFQFADLEEGQYAISAFYDADSNGELKTGAMGIPSEKVAFSNGAKGVFGPPSFKAAAFLLKESKTITITLGKARD